MVYAGHIVAMGRLSGPGTAMSLSVVQMVVIAVLCTVARCAVAGTGRASSCRPRARLAGGAVPRAGRRRADDGAADLGAGPDRAVAGRGDHGHGAGLGGRLRGALGGERVTVRMVIGGLAILAAMYLVELAPRQPESRLAEGLRSPR